jgi:hypothetical protein
MNGKQAKRLRKEAAFSNDEPTNYVAKYHKVKEKQLVNVSTDL